MATRRKTAITQQPEWETSSEPVQLTNGTTAIQWKSNATGELKMLPIGLHPQDQQTITNEDYENLIEEDLEETATDRISTMLQAASDVERAELKVYRVNQGQLEYCRAYKPDEFEDGNFEMLRERFGAGEYELRLYATNPATRKFVVRNKTRLKIAEDKIPPDSMGGLPNGLGQVLATIANGQQQMLQALVDIKQAPAKDPMEEMTKMLSMMTMMREAMGLNQTREKSSIGEIVGAIRELRNASEEIAPPKDDEPSLMNMLPKVLDMVSKTQDSQLAQSQLAPMQQVHLPPNFQDQTSQGQQFDPNTAQQLQQQPFQPQPTEHDNMKALAFLKLNGYVKSLCDMASKNETIAAGAQYVFDKIPDDLIEIMELDNWFDLFATVAPMVKPHEAWLRQVRDAALKLFDEPENSTTN